MRISDWSSDVCSSDLDLAVEQALRFQGLDEVLLGAQARHAHPLHQAQRLVLAVVVGEHQAGDFVGHGLEQLVALFDLELARLHLAVEQDLDVDLVRSEEHTSELQSLMRNSYAVFSLKKKKSKHILQTTLM